MLKIRVTKKKDGREVPWFRGAEGRVGIRARTQNWAVARQLTELALYGMELQKEQAAKCLGSSGLPLPGLKRRYAIWKTKRGLGNRRNLYALGDRGGHMLEAMRINYISDTRVDYAITDSVNRAKARGNERRTPWFGWSPGSLRKLMDRAAVIFRASVADRLFTLGLIGVDQMTKAVAASKRHVQKLARAA